MGQRMRKKFTLRHSIPVDEIERSMQRWIAQAPRFTELFSIGKSGAHDIYCAKMTDPSIPDDEKEIAIVTAQHTGMEISGMNAVFGAGNLLSNLGEDALEILRKQIILLVPCPNPYTYALQDPSFQFRNAAGVCEYAHAFGWQGVVNPDKTPAARALQTLIDTWRPEAFFDNHGVWYQDQIMLESDGNVSFSNTNRFHDHRFALQIEQQIEQSGYTAFDEGDSQALPFSGEISLDPEHKRKFQSGSEGIVAQGYAYLNYHTLVGSSEVSWEESGTLRIMKCLQLGSSVWDGEISPGYPVRTVLAPIGLNALKVGGSNAAQRRNSRVELWNNLHRLSTGIMHPEMPGLSCLIVATSGAKCRRIFAGHQRMSMDTVMDRLDTEGMDTTSMRRQLDNHWDGVYAAINLQDQDELRLQYGLTLRIGLPYPNAVPTEVLLNGQVLPPDPLNGWTLICHRSKVDVDIHVPPQDTDFYIAMVRYTHDQRDNAIVTA